MEDFNRKKHWESIYLTKEQKDLSWFEPSPETSLKFFKKFNVPKTAKVIDVGGGDSLLVDSLLDRGYRDITILDISETALDRTKQRLGHRAAMVKWIVADAANFQPPEKYDIWHDRALFHFLTSDGEIAKYLKTAHANIAPHGIIIIGVFSERGPEKCSGIQIKRYSEKDMSILLQHYFKKVECLRVEHKTPFNSLQDFIFCSFRKEG